MNYAELQMYCLKHPYCDNDCLLCRAFVSFCRDDERRDEE